MATDKFARFDSRGDFFEILQGCEVVVSSTECQLPCAD